MKQNRMLALAIIVIGVVANNYVYLHDIVTYGHNGAIHLGWKAAAGIVVSLLVVAVGIIMVFRAEASASRT